MIPEIVIQHIEECTVADLVRLYNIILEKKERARKENPKSFSSIQWSVNHPEKAKEKNRIQSQKHRDKLKEDIPKSNLKI